MKDTLILLETAKLAKEKGFDWSTNYGYVSPGEQKDYIYETLPNGWTVTCYTDRNWFSPLDYNDANEPNVDWEQISAPTQSLLQTWLRETKDCMVWVEPIYYDGWYFKCHIAMSNGKFLEILPTEEEINTNDWPGALEEGLQEALKSL